MTDQTPLEQAQQQRDENAHNIATSHETTREDKTPLERVQEQQQENLRN